jgi:hypothetical protein
MAFSNKPQKINVAVRTAVRGSVNSRNSNLASQYIIIELSKGDSVNKSDNPRSKILPPNLNIMPKYAITHASLSSLFLEQVRPFLT